VSYRQRSVHLKLKLCPRYSLERQRHLAAFARAQSRFLVVFPTFCNHLTEEQAERWTLRLFGLHAAITTRGAITFIDIKGVASHLVFAYRRD
jgi:hypothetical protein